MALAREGAEPDIYIRWRVEGADGLARGTIGWPGYPARVPSTLDFTTKHHAGWQSPRWPEAWLPDAFAGTMAQLLCSKTGPIRRLAGPRQPGNDRIVRGGAQRRQRSTASRPCGNS